MKYTIETRAGYEVIRNGLGGIDVEINPTHLPSHLTARSLAEAILPLLDEQNHVKDKETPFVDDLGLDEAEALCVAEFNHLSSMGRSAAGWAFRCGWHQANGKVKRAVLNKLNVIMDDIKATSPDPNAPATADRHRQVRGIIHKHLWELVGPLPDDTAQACDLKTKQELNEANETIAMLAQQLADKKEIIRRLTT